MSQPTTRREFLRTSTLASATALCGPLAFAREQQSEKGQQQPIFRAGAAEVDISPPRLPVIVSGGFLEGTGGELRDRLFARGIVLDDGRTRLALVVVDNLMMPREMLDQVKAKAAASTGIPEKNIVISATHTHSAPSVVGALGTGVDEAYAAFLPGKLVECVEKAAAATEPARVGWASVVDSEDTNCRVWIRRPDRIGEDPFGQNTVRAMMHPGYQNPDYLGPCGPEDPELTVLSIVRADGTPLALLANYSMHYFGAAPISADYYGRFSAIVSETLSKQGGGRPCVAMMSHGTSGDQHWMDYSSERKAIDLETYARRVAARALEACGRVEHRDWVPLASAATTLRLRRRLPGEERLAWARGLVEAMGDRRPASRPEVYAREQMYLVAEPERDLRLQAFGIGDLAIAAIPCEVYAITGLKLKGQSPFGQTMNIELAGGGEGYIPPPELFPFGGYNTWPARSAGLETTAEPKIVEALLTLMEQLAKRPRRAMPRTSGPYADLILEHKPAAYWPLDTIGGATAEDRSPRGNHGEYETGVAFFLEGPDVAGLSRPDGPIRAAHFADARLVAPAVNLGDAWSVEIWFYNCLPSDARAVTGYLFSRGPDGVKGAPGDHLGIGGNHHDGSLAGKLFFYNGDQREELIVGTTIIEPKTWHHVVLVRDGSRVAAYLDGRATPEFSGDASPGSPAGGAGVFIGGRSDKLYNFEGKLCQAAVYDRPLAPEEITAHWSVAAGLRTSAKSGKPG